LRDVIPDAHAWTRDTRKLDGARETLVTLRVIILEADLHNRLADVTTKGLGAPYLKLDGFEEVALLLVERVVKKALHVGAHSGDCDFTHDGDSLPEER